MDLEREDLGLGARPGLILVDMICGFTDPECPLGTACPGVIEANQRLLAAFRSKRLPVFFTAVIYHSEDQAPVFRNRLPALNVLQPGSKWVQVDPRLGIQPDETLIEKQWASGFHKTDLDEALRAADVDSLVVTGLTTSGCVRATAVDGLQYNYRVVVASDAVGDRNQESHEANLVDLNAKYADVKTSLEIIDLLQAP